jgi:hypothetical protein
MQLIEKRVKFVVAANNCMGRIIHRDDGASNKI